MDDPIATVQGIQGRCQLSQVADFVRCRTNPLGESSLDERGDLRPVGTRPRLGAHRLHDLTHGFRSSGACCGSTRYFGVDDRLKFLFAHGRRKVALEHREFGTLARLGVDAAGFFIDVCGLGALLGFGLQHPDDLLVGQRHCFVAGHCGVLHRGNRHAQRRLLRLVACFYRRRQIMLQLLEQTRHAFSLPCALGTTSHPSRLGTLGRVSDEQLQLFFALLALLALAGSVALVVARLVGGAARPLLDGLAPLRLPVPALVTSVAMLGSLWFSEVVGYRPCVLCWYQRIAMYSLAIVLVVAAVRRDRSIVPYAMVLAGVGATVSVYHWLLERWPSIDTGSCSPDAPCSVPYFEVFGFVSLAFMALCAFVTVLVFLGVLSGQNAARMEPA